MNIFKRDSFHVIACI